VEEMEVKVINTKKEEVGTVNLNDKIFNTPLHKHAIWLTVNWQLAKRRAGTASTKTRGEVRGGGRKPWPQKHTGRARQGSIRAPQWVGGGVVHGPKPRDWSFKLNKKVRRLALKSVLSQRLREGNLIVVEDFEFPEIKTKYAKEVLKNLGLENEKVLIIVPEKYDEKMEKIWLSFRNLPKVKVLPVDGLNVYDIVCYPKVLVFKSVLPKIEERLAK
jgi:large subunit ribosomal protein L4